RAEGRRWQPDRRQRSLWPLPTRHLRNDRRPLCQHRVQRYAQRAASEWADHTLRLRLGPLRRGLARRPHHRRQLPAGPHRPRSAPRSAPPAPAPPPPPPPAGSPPGNTPPPTTMLPIGPPPGDSPSGANAPQAPTNLQFTIAGAGATLNWGASPGGNVKDYAI